MSMVRKQILNKKDEVGVSFGWIGFNLICLSYLFLIVKKGRKPMSNKKIDVCLII
jgi:hypothetical protein